MIYPQPKEHEVQMTTLSDTSTPSFGGHTFITGPYGTPVYYEGEGEGGAAAPAAPAAPAAEPAAPAPATPAAPAPVIPAGDPFDDPTADKFDRPYVEKLRKEAAEHRTAAKAYQDAFARYPDEARQAMLEIVQGLTAEDGDTVTSTATQLRQLAAQLLGEELNADDPDRPLTKADYDRIQQEQKAKADEDRAVQEVISEAKTLGYEPETPGAADLLWRAVNVHNGDLKAAHEAIQAERQAIIDDYVKSVQEGNVKFPPVTGNVGDGAPQGGSEDAPKTFAEAKTRAMARARAYAGS